MVSNQIKLSLALGKNFGFNTINCFGTVDEQSLQSCNNDVAPDGGVGSPQSHLFVCKYKCHLLPGLPVVWRPRKPHPSQLGRKMTDLYIDKRSVITSTGRH